jgi:carbamoyltransferase
LGWGRRNRIGVLREFNYPHSLGFFYEEIARFLGFRRNHDEHKVDALAGYGKPKLYDRLRNLIRLSKDGGYDVRMDFRRSGTLAARDLVDLLGPPRLWGAEITERHADIAASAQKVLEDTVLHVLRALSHQVPIDSLCLAGGVVLNCQLNERIRSEAGFKNIYIQPAANDAGTALGAALWVHHQILNRPRIPPMKHVYLGPEYSEKEIETALCSRKLGFARSSDIAYDCARLIAGGKIIGWFQGRMEWGPRALGNRSILADPRDLQMKDRINKIKGRENFRPVAPAVLAEVAGQYFECCAPSPYMLFARKARSEVRDRIPSALHVDGTARVQTVDPETNPLFHRLINHFQKLTGVPMILNTSLNYAGKPIVCTIDQALDCYFNSGLDYIALGPFLVAKTELPNEIARDYEGSANLALQRSHRTD